MKPSGDLAADLLEFIRRKFYEGDNVQFAKDKRRLLEWVILWPAKELDDGRYLILPVLPC